MIYRSFIACLFALVVSHNSYGSWLVIPMDSSSQANHLRAYGVVYAALQEHITVEWLLNYRGGSFGMAEREDMEELCKQRGVSYAKQSDKQYAQITREIQNPAFNGSIMQLEKAPRIAVYTPPNKEPWDDAVTLALTYAQIPFDKVYADEVLRGDLANYDWLHLHHEDFTGQYGKFWAQFQNADWYKNDQKSMEELATKHGYKKVSQMQLAVVKKIRDFVGAGGNLFAMCSATETFDIALAAEGIDICAEPFDGDPADPAAQGKLDFSNCFAFKDFTITSNPFIYGHSNIDNTMFRHVAPEDDYFKVASPQAKLDPVPAMLCQNHTRRVRGFMGQTTAFRTAVIKQGVVILGMGALPAAGDTAANSSSNEEARYIHGEFGKGAWTFYGGHDPEDYEHRVGDPVTDLNLYPHSPGYRLILDNILLPAVKKGTLTTAVKTDTKEVIAATSSIATANIKLYPNAASEELLVTNAGGKIEQVVIVNAAGEEIINRSYNAEKVNISTKEWAPGMYLIRVNGADVGRVVKE